MKEVSTVKRAMLDVAADPRASRLERIEASRLLMAAVGILVPSTMEPSKPDSKLAIQMQMARKVILEKMGLRRERTSRKNRKAYLVRKIKAAEAEQAATQTQGTTQETTTNE